MSNKINHIKTYLCVGLLKMESKNQKKLQKVCKEGQKGGRGSPNFKRTKSYQNESLCRVAKDRIQIPEGKLNSFY